MAALGRLTPALSIALCIALFATILTGIGLNSSVRGEVFPSASYPAARPSSAVPGQWTTTNITLGPPGGYPTNALFVNQTAQVFTTVYPSYVVVASATTGAVVARIDVGQPVSELAYDNVTNEVLVAGPSTNELFAVNASTDQLVRNVSLLQPAAAMSFDGANGELLVMIEQITNTGNGTITVGGTILVMDGTQRSYPLLASLTNVAYIGWLGPNTFMGSMTVDTVRQVVYITGPVGWSGYAGVQWFELSSPSVGGSYLGAGGGTSTFDAQTDTIYVVGGPAVSPGSPNAQISVISGMTHNVTGVITPNSTTWIESMSLDPASQRLYEIDSAGRVYAIDTLNNSVVASYSLPPNCGTGISVDEQRGSVYIPDTCGDELLVLTPTDGRVSRITVGGGAPAGIAYDNRTGDIVVANSLASNVTIVSTANQRVVATVNAIPGASAAVYDPKTSDDYVVGEEGTVAILNDQNWTVSDEFALPMETIPEGYGLVAAAYDPATSQVYVSTANDANGTSFLYLISDTSHAIVGNFEINTAEALDVDALMFDSVNGAMWIGSDSGYIGWINWPELTLTRAPSSSETISVYSLALDGSTDTVYAGVVNDSTYSGNGDLVGINASLGSVRSVTGVGSHPSALVWCARSHEVLSASYEDSNVSVVNDSTNVVVATLSVGQGPTAVAYDNATGAVYVANMWSDTVSVLTPISTTPPPTSPPGAAAPWWLYAILGIPTAAAAIGVFQGFRQKNPSTRVARNHRI